MPGDGALQRQLRGSSEGERGRPLRLDRQRGCVGQGRARKSCLVGLAESLDQARRA
jgi:hypothetical protein